MLPDIKIMLPLIFIAWCVTAYFAFESFVMLAYPAIWAGIGLAFFILHKVTSPSGESTD